MSDYTPIQVLGEFGLIERIRTLLGPPSDEDVRLGIDDDAAVYHVGDDRVHVVTTDALIEGVHFDRSFVPLLHLGLKTVAVNVSDVVAMNARPRFATLALGLPETMSVEQVEAFYEGVRQGCATYGVTLVGGDTTAARYLTVVLTVIGEARESDVIFRRGARPGDLLCVTGDLGGAYAGLKVLLDQRQALRETGGDFEPNLDPFRYVIARQLTPTARLATLEDWARRRVRPRALIDVSDGLASEVHHLCRQSGCGAIIRAASLPIHPETRAVADQFLDDVDTYALFGGEDYELLFALPEDELDRLDPESYTVVGQFTEASEGVRIQTPEGLLVPLDAQGYQHFRTDDHAGDGGA
ncbi:MAG: thiamine-monophosphate kinase [Rhodothermaceae bacterium]|nr:MAG: thiamine-monophosphate kinase [Rhodothermaceae bacterium]